MWNILVFNIKAQIISFEWVKSIRGQLLERVTSVSTDDAGYIYSTGYFAGTADFDPGENSTNLVSLGGRDIFIQKLDTNGDLIWAISIGGTLDDTGSSIETDALGNILVTGFFQGTTDFDPGPGITNRTSSGAQDIFIMKLDHDGNLLWAKAFGGTSDDRGFSVAGDALGNVYCTGRFSGSINVGSINLNPSGSFNSFVIKLDASGNTLFAKSIGGTSSITSWAISSDVSGNTFVSGNYAGTTDFDPGPSTSLLTSVGSSNSFLLKLDVNGNFLWVNSIEGSNSSTRSIATDAFGNSYTVGSFNGTVDFDPGFGTTSVTSLGTSDLFIQKLDPNRGLLWAKSMGGSVDGRSVVLDIAGNLYITGYFNGTTDFDPNAGNVDFTSSEIDIFILKLDPLGNLVWAGTMGGASSDAAYSVAVDGTGNIYVGGDYFGTADFNPGSGIASLTSVDGNVDTFLLKLSQCAPTAPIPHAMFLSDIIAECYIDTFIAPTASDNCGTIFIGTPNVTLPVTTQGTTVVTWSFDDQKGNISTQLQNIIINDITAPVPSLASLPDIIDECPVGLISRPTSTDNCSGSVNGASNVSFPISSSGTTIITWTFDDGNGNTSTQVQRVTILPINNTVTQNSNELRANATGYLYQWIDCANGNTLIDLETNINFTPNSNGNYAVVISNGRCAVTSNCFLVTIVGLKETIDKLGIVVYPNPTSHRLQIINESYHKLFIELYDNTCKLMISQESNKQVTIVDLSEIATGNYILNVTIMGRTVSRKVVKH